MEELVDAVLAGVENAKAKGRRRYVYVLPIEGDIVVFEGLVQERISNCVVNHMTITHHTGRIEKQLIIDW